MRECMEEVKNLLKAKIQCIWINTYEEVEVMEDLKEIVLDMVKNGSSVSLFAWSTAGLSEVPVTSFEEEEKPDGKVQFGGLMAKIDQCERAEEHKISIFVLKDLHLFTSAPQVVRGIRDLKERHRIHSYCPIIVISPITQIPVEWEKLFTIVDYELLKKEDILLYIKSISKKIKAINSKKGNYTVPTEDEIQSLATACIGLTKRELSDVLFKSLVKYNALTIDSVMAEKVQLVKKSGVLDYKVPKIKFEDMGGNHAFKTWVEEIQDSFGEDAKAFGCPQPKGYLALGVPGGGKTAFAEAIANMWKVPFLQLNMSKIMNKLVGESERKIAQAFQVAKACAPCVLLVDEVEKALSGELI